MMATTLGFVSHSGNGNAREAGEGSSFSLSPLPQRLGHKEYNLSKEGSTNE